MKTYPKLYNLYKRDEQTKKLIMGEYALPEFEAIQTWSVTEKIDGTNIRIEYADGQIAFGGRTSEAEIPDHLMDSLKQTFTDQLLASVFPKDEQSEAFPRITLFGEGYGPKIQSAGSNYRQSAGFILFDVFANGWWLKRCDVDDVAHKLGIESVPLITFREFVMEWGMWRTYQGIRPIKPILEYVQSKPLSKCSHIPQMMEGVVCRSEPLMLFRNGDPIMFKLRCKDFV